LHADAAKALGVGADATHSKILSNANIRPLSVERRLELDSLWKETRAEIRAQYVAEDSPPLSSFATSAANRDRWLERMNKLDKMAASVNEAIISDSLRFNGKSPVTHARPFVLEERLREAADANDEESAAAKPWVFNPWGHQQMKKTKR
jgi:hypothetical protein